MAEIAEQALLASGYPEVSREPGDDGYAAAIDIWGKSVGDMARAIGHCRATEDARGPKIYPSRNKPQDRKSVV